MNILAFLRAIRLRTGPMQGSDGSAGVNQIYMVGWGAAHGRRINGRALEARRGWADSAAQPETGFIRPVGLSRRGVVLLLHAIALLGGGEFCGPFRRFICTWSRWRGAASGHVVTDASAAEVPRPRDHLRDGRGRYASAHVIASGLILVGSIITTYGVGATVAGCRCDARRS